MSSVRAARFQLAQALNADDLRNDEAVEQMWRVLDDRGTEPSDATVYTTLVEMYERRDDMFGALRVAVLGISRSPVDHVGTVEHALAMLDRLPGIAGDLPDDIVQKLEDSVTSLPDASEARFLAGRLRLERGEFEHATALLAQTPHARSAPALIRIAKAELALGKANKARESLLAAQSGFGSWRGLSWIFGGQDSSSQEFQLLLSRAQAETGHYKEALKVLPEGRTSEHAFVRALAYLGQGQLALALAECANQSSLDILLLRAIVYLQSNDFEKSRTEILAASARNSSTPGVLLVRAQVELESAGNLDEGRALLERVFETTNQNLLTTRWLALQKPFEKKRARFQYFLVEAADVSGDEEAIALARATERTSTEHVQDGRLDSILGNWLARTDDAAGAVEAFESAADNFEKGEMTLAALTASQRVFDLAPSGRVAARLVRLRWQVSLRDMSLTERLHHLAEARTILDSHSFSEERADTDALVYYDGLVSAREANLVERDQQSVWWRAVVSFLAAVLNSEKDAYRARFLAEALRKVGANGAAVVFANRALEWYADDSTREEAVVSRANYYRGLAHVEELLGQFENHDVYNTWIDAVRAALRLDSGEHEGLVTLSDSPVDQPWARFSLTRSVALFKGISEARTRFTTLAEELSTQAGSECDAALTKLFLGRIDDARRSVSAGEERQNDIPASVAWIRALVDLASDANRDLSVAVESVKRLTPIRVGGAFYVDLPLLRKVYDTKPFGGALAQLLNRMVDVVKAPIPEPTIHDGLELAPEPHRHLLQAMAQLLDSVESGNDVTRSSQQVRALLPGGRLQAVLAAACNRAESADDTSVPESPREDEPAK